MLTRRMFAGCALCAVTGFVATGAEAQNALGGLKRTIITRTDGPMEGYEAVNVEAQRDNPHSLLWWMRRIVSLRKTSEEGPPHA